MKNLFAFLIILSLLSTLARGVDRPNIVFILADDLGFNDIGYHAKNHGSEITTPFLDQLAAEGIKLENYYVQPRCTPTRGQLMTGRHPASIGMQNGVIWPSDRKGLPLDNKLLPEQLKSCGYDTHMVGKWHLGHSRREYLPHERGFNSYFGLLTDSGNFNTHERCYKGTCGIDMYDSERGPVNDTWGEYSTHLFTRKSIESIRNRNSSEPFFLYLSYQSVHLPIRAPREYHEPFQHIKNKRRRKYAGMVSAMDESVQNVTEYLKKSGLLDNTIIIFSTDNGGEPSSGNNWPLRGMKWTLWEGGIRAVGFIHGKPLGVHGTIHNGLLDASDWFPTLLRAAGCAKMNGTQPLDGVDQWDALRQKSKSPRTEILHHIGPTKRRKREKAVGEFNTRVNAAIRVGPWKLLTGNPGPSIWLQPPESGEAPVRLNRKGQQNPDLWLFNITRDPTERDNIAQLHPDIVQFLLMRLKHYQSKIIPGIPSQRDPASDPKYHGGFWVPWINNTVEIRKEIAESFVPAMPRVE